MAGFHDEDGSSKRLLHHIQLKSNCSSKKPKKGGSETINTIKNMTWKSAPPFYFFLETPSPTKNYDQRER